MTTLAPDMKMMQMTANPPNHTSHHSSYSPTLMVAAWRGSALSFSTIPHCFAAHCQDVTSLITGELDRKGSAILSYTDDFGGVATDKATAATHFNNLRDPLVKVGL